MSYIDKVAILMLIAGLVSLPIVYYLRRKAKKEGRSTKYIPLKALFITVYPVGVMGLLFSDINFSGKIFFSMLLCLYGVLHYFYLEETTITFGKRLGFRYDDEDVVDDMKSKIAKFVKNIIRR